jgi:choline kinase
MIGLVLAAGAGRRLLPHTEHIPKTLLRIADDRTILDSILANLAGADLTDVALVVGHHADAIKVRVPELESRHGVRLQLVHNHRVDWNNAYSLWLARDLLADGALLVNGDTVHPVGVERALLGSRTVGVQLAVDAVKTLTDEAMKVQLDGDDRVVRITKQMPVETAHGEYIGAALIEPAAALELAECLAQTWRHDPGRYYEDGFQLLADRTGGVRARRIGTVEWVEVDDTADLARARELACRC